MTEAAAEARKFSRENNKRVEFVMTDEMEKQGMTIANLLGAAICTKKGTHATVTAITEALPKKAQLILKIVVHIVVMTVAYVLIRYGLKVVASTRMQLSPALCISMSFVYASAPVPYLQH